jgi:NAD kinase
MSRVVLVSEVTRLGQEIAKEGSLDSVRRKYPEDTFDKDLVRPDGQYKVEYEHVRRALRAYGASVVDCLRHEAQNFVFRDDDVVVILGDDGALVNIAKLLTCQRVITIGTSTKYCGRLMKFTVETFAASLPRFFQKEVSSVHVTIARAVTSLGHSLEAVNDFFVGRADLRSSRYGIERAFGYVDQISSGVIVSTGTGSTGWEKSVCKNDERYIERPLDDTTLHVVTRELFFGDDLGVLRKVRKVTFRSNDNDTRVIADGVLFDSSMLLLPAGETVTITSNVRSVQLLT